MSDSAPEPSNAAAPDASDSAPTPAPLPADLTQADPAILVDSVRESVQPQRAVRRNK